MPHRRQQHTPEISPLLYVVPEEPGWTAPDQPAAGAVPTVSSWVVPRARVTREVLDRLERFSLVHVVGSAGAGKTTAMVQAAAALDWPVAWLTIANWHRAPGRLLDALIQSLGSVVAGLDHTNLRIRNAEQGLAETAALAARTASQRDIVLVLDDSHVLQGADEAVAVLGAFVSNRQPGLRIVFVGRAQLGLPGVGVDELDHASFITEDVLTANREEAAAILAARQSAVDAEVALRASSGWIAGLVFETWRAAASAGSLDPFAEYLRREVRSRLTGQEERLLFAAAILDALDARRAASLGAEDPAGLLRTFQAVGVPATWTRGGSRMVFHPRVREALRAELTSGSPARLQTLLRAAAAAYEREGNDELREIKKIETADYIIQSTGGTIGPGLVQDLESVHGVQKVVPFRRESVTLNGKASRLFTGDIQALSKIAGIQLKSGTFAAVKPGAIAVLEQDHIPVGSTVTVASSSGKSQKLEVAAILKTSLDTVLTGNYSGKQTFDALVGDTAPTVAFLDTAPGTQSDTKDAIEARTDQRPDIDLTEGNAMGRLVASVFDFLINAVNGLLAMSILIAVIGIVNTLSLSIFERRRELGLLRAVGMTDRRVQRMVRLEAVIISVIGTVSGVLLGLFVGWSLVHSINRLSSADVAFSLPGVRIVIVLALGVILGVLAALIPARRSTRLDVLDAIQTT